MSGVSWWRSAKGEAERKERAVIQMYCKSRRDNKGSWSQSTELFQSIFSEVSLCESFSLTSLIDSK